jgi:hypothetical protein
VRQSQITTAAERPAEASRRPSGEHATASTSRLLPPLLVGVFN